MYPPTSDLVSFYQISWERINTPADVLKVGDEVDVRITEVDFDKKRVSLSMKELLPKPNADEAEADDADDAE